MGSTTFKVSGFCNCTTVHSSYNNNLNDIVFTIAVPLSIGDNRELLKRLNVSRLDSLENTIVCICVKLMHS